MLAVTDGPDDVCGALRRPGIAASAVHGRGVGHVQRLVTERSAVVNPVTRIDVVVKLLEK